MADREWKDWPFAPAGTPAGTMAYVTDTGQFAPVEGTLTPGARPTVQLDGVTIAWEISDAAAGGLGSALGAYLGDD